MLNFSEFFNIDGTIVAENPATLRKADRSGNQKEEQKKTETGDNTDFIIYFLEFLIYRIFQKSLRWMT